MMLDTFRVARHGWEFHLRFIGGDGGCATFGDALVVGESPSAALQRVLFEEFVQSGGDFLAGGGFHAVDEEHSVEVVVFVLNGAGKQPGGLEFQCAPVEQHRADADIGRAFNFGTQPGKA